MKSKSDYSTTSSSAYQYFSGTNKLKSVALKGGGTASFGYDAKGNQTHRNGTSEVIYNVFNKPTSINRLGSQVSLYCDANWMRHKQVRVVNGKTVTTHYIDKMYEVEFESGKSKTTSYISDVALLIEDEYGAKIRFTHKDRLGSTATFTNEKGQATAYRSYDPFGKPKMGDGSLMSSLGLRARLSNNLADLDQATRRGFTDHEHLDEVEIIHMNGRVYDYNVGRFMGVDPFIQGLGSQGLNPYSYILNNPLAGTDPTGYTAEVETEEVKKVSTGSRIAKKTGEIKQTVSTTSGGVTTTVSKTTGQNGATFSSTSSGGGWEGHSLGTITSTDIGSPEQLAKSEQHKAPTSALDSGGANNQSGASSTSSLKDNYDISEAPSNNSIGGGKSYEDLSEDQKYAVHMTNEALLLALRLVKSSKDPQVQSLDTTSINAVWYESVGDKGVWTGPLSSGTLARAKYIDGENIQFYGDRMVDFLPGGRKIGRSIDRLKKGYYVHGIPAGKEAFRYIVGHELGHVTRLNSILPTSQRRERNADTFYKQLFKNM